MKLYIKIASISLVLIVFLYACIHHHAFAPKALTQVMTVTSSSITTTLFYAGIIQPVKLSTMTSLTDGVIEKMLFHYGDYVKQGQLLFIIASEKFHSDYKTLLMQYVKARADFLTNKNQLAESQFLHKNQLISDDEFRSKESAFYNARLEMAQSKSSLATVLKRLDLSDYNIYDLKIEDIDRITQLLQSEDGSQRIQMVAPRSGVILQPPKVDNSDGELKKIIPGDQAKSGDILATIADITCLAVHINVSEFNINQLKLGQKVKVTGAAFPNIVLEGKVTELNHQGESSQNSIPTFPVNISVVNLTPAEQAVIRMGMSVKVAIDVAEGEKITVPIHAVLQKNNEFYVLVQDDPSGKVHEVAVKIGKTTIDSVVVESNLSAGEKIVVAG